MYLGILSCPFRQSSMTFYLQMYKELELYPFHLTNSKSWQMSFQKKSIASTCGWVVYFHIPTCVERWSNHFFSSISHWVKIQLHPPLRQNDGWEPNLVVKLWVSINFWGHIFSLMVVVVVIFKFFMTFSGHVFSCHESKGFDVLLIPQHFFYIYHTSTIHPSHTTITYHHPYTTSSIHTVDGSEILHHLRCTKPSK